MAQLVGKFVSAMPVVSGEKDGREWQRIQFGVMSLDNNAKLVAFDAFGEEKVQIVQSMQAGQTVMVDYVPESREFGGRYYTNLNMIRLQVAMKVDPNAQNNGTTNA